MKFNEFFTLIAMTFSLPVAAEPLPDPHAVPPMDAPELAALGNFAIGTSTIEVNSSIEVKLTAAGVISEPRSIRARVWYPAHSVQGSSTTSFEHVLPKQDGTSIKFAISSLAVTDAQAIAGQRFPVVIVSHGYNGWDSFMTWLTENLATKGYVVIAINHADERVTNPAEFPVSFGNVLINRAADIRAVIDDLDKRQGRQDDPIGHIIDAEKIALVGYSMGGFGSLGAAGLNYNPESPVFTQMPPVAKDAIFASQNASDEIANRIKAVVALAPFGGRSDVRVWSEDELATWRKPTLIIDGDNDDIVEFKGGVEWLFDKMTNSERQLLIFQNARHNVGGNPPPPQVYDDFSSFEYFAEPVWRTERINAINQHFITAFLGLHLKGEQSMAPYLAVNPSNGGDGQWPLAPFQNVGGQVAGEEQGNYWRGFQRRWAIGLEMRIGEPEND